MGKACSEGLSNRMGAKLGQVGVGRSGGTQGPAGWGYTMSGPAERSEGSAQWK